MKGFTPILGKRVRVTEVDDCGAVFDGAKSATTEGFVSVSLTPEVEDGQEIVLRNANGGIAVNEQGNPSFKNFGLEIEFSKVLPDILAIISNAEIYDDGKGFTVPEGEITKRFALEVWTGISGVGCGDGGEASGYLLLPFVMAGTLGDLTVDGENAVTVTLTNSSTRGGNAWGKGPYKVVLEDDVGEKLPSALDPFDHLLISFTDLAPPPVQESATAVPTD